MTVHLYHNPRCSKSRATLALLEERGIRPQVRLYLQDPPTTAELESVCAQLGLAPRALIRSGESAYRELGLDDEGLGDEALLAAMAAHPILIQRPIVLSGGRAAIGRPPEAVLEIL